MRIRVIDFIDMPGVVVIKNNWHRLAGVGWPIKALWPLIVTFYSEGNRTQDGYWEVDTDLLKRFTGFDLEFLFEAIDTLHTVGVIEIEPTFNGVICNSKENTKLPRLAIIWNQNCGALPKVRFSNPTRSRKANLLFKEQSEDAWADTVRRISKSKFCCGDNERGWLANFDFLLRKETWMKVQEGLYDTRGKKKGGGW